MEAKDLKVGLEIVNFNKNMEEKFTEIHHQITIEFGKILSSLGANSGVMALMMSWGDTQDSESTLEMLKDYNQKYSTSKSTISTHV